MNEIKVLTKDLKELKLTPRLYSQAADNGMTLSQLLETMSPTEPEDKLDAFERVLKKQGINVNGNPKAGIPAGQGRLFFTSDDNTVLFPEFLNRAARVALVDTTTTNLQDIVSSIQNIATGTVVRNLYITQTAAQKRKKDVAEAAEIPRTTLTWSDKTARGTKKGIGLEWSYEFIQQVSLPVLQTAIAGIVQQNSIDDISDAIEVLIQGDGTSVEGSLLSDDSLSSYGGVTGNSTIADITYTAWIEWLLAMLPYSPITCVTTQAGYARLMNVQTASNTMPLWLYTLISTGQTGGAPNPQSGLRMPNPLITVHSSIMANKILAVDKRYAMQAYTYAGMDLTETQRVISRQVEQMYMTTTIFFSCIFRDAVKQLDCTG